MIKTGLVSITFRGLKPVEIVNMVSKAGLQGIEWGGDIHVPHGNAQAAREVYNMTVESGLEVAAYGSYYRMDKEDKGLDEFKKVLESAALLHAPIIRVWAGSKASRDADEAWFQQVVDLSRDIAGLAQKAGIAISYEYHGNTLTDTNESALRLLKEVNHENIKSYWQPPNPMNFDERYAGLCHILPWLTNVHVFHWIYHGAQGNERRPLSEGIRQWGPYIKKVKESGRDHFAMIEFVKDDRLEQFFEDAETLKELIIG